MPTLMESQRPSDGAGPPQFDESGVSLDVPKPVKPAAPGYQGLIVVCLTVWFLAVVAGLSYGFRYEITPAEAGVIARRWPADSARELSPERPTLLMFVHPRCPCSRASLNELASLMTHCRGRVDACVLFNMPRSSPADWARSDLWDIAAGIPGVEPRLDLDGAERRRFGTRISGEVLLFWPDGELAFHGGITGGRGHEGDNEGRTALEWLLGHRRTVSTTVPVFGCELESPAEIHARHHLK